jgi:hypothetical protein
VLTEATKHLWDTSGKGEPLAELLTSIARELKRAGHMQAAAKAMDAVSVCRQYPTLGERRRKFWR